MATLKAEAVSRTIPNCVDRSGRDKWWRRCGTKRRGFTYADSKGQPLKETEVERILALVIPPAWTEVRIAPSPRSPLQVIGIDVAGRAQYRYHAKFVAKQSQQKYDKLLRFGEILPCLRQATNAHISGHDLDRDRVLAVTLRLINDLYFRVGSEESVERYDTFGITTLQNRHLIVKENGTLAFDFVGKKHIRQKRLLVDKDLAETLKEIKALRGKHLFQYRAEDGTVHQIRARDVNAYIKDLTGPEFSAKDFRTWGGTLHAAVALAEIGVAETETQRKKNIVAATKAVAEWLGNTPAVCRASYIHPIVFDWYAKGMTLEDFKPRHGRRISKIQAEYEPEEISLMAMLRTSPPST